MNTFLRLSLGILLLSSPTLADALITSRTSSIGDNISAVLQQLKDAKAELDALEPKLRETARERGDILFSVEAYKKQFASYQSQLTDHNMRVDAFQAEREQHNAHPCHSPDTPMSECGGYNSEAETLVARQAVLKKEGADLDKTKALLDELQKINTEKTLQWTAKAKPIAVQAGAAQDRYRDLYNRLQAMKARYAECSKALSDEAMKHQCGNIQFDGANKMLDELTDRMIKPPFSIFPN